MVSWKHQTTSKEVESHVLVISFRAFVVNFKADLSFYRKQKLILYTKWLYKNVVHHATSIIVMVIIYNKTKTEPCVCGD